MSGLRWLASALNPFQPIRGRYPVALALTVMAAVVLEANIGSRWIPGIAIGAAESLLCPIGPLTYGLYHRIRPRFGR